MTTAVPNERNEERRRRVLLGPLPAGFLQTTPSSARDTDRQIAMALQHHLYVPNMPLSANVGRLSMTIVQAKLVKNYGLTRMDPYVRLRVGHCIYETHTDPSGGKTPRWNKVVHCLLPPGVTSIYLEIFDECSFSMDELIAWTHINIPATVMNGETHEDWYPLNGKQGDGMEGMINLVISYTSGAAPVNHYTQMVVMPNQPYTAIPVYPPAMPAPNQTQQPAPVQPLVITDEQVKQIAEIFPSIEREVIKSVLEANNGNKDDTINSLLQMSE